MSPLRMKTKVLSVLSVMILVLTAAIPASAEIVVLSSGRTFSVKSHRIDGELIVLTLRNGGDVTCEKSLIDKILPD